MHILLSRRQAQLAVAPSPLLKSISKFSQGGVVINCGQSPFSAWPADGNSCIVRYPQAAFKAYRKGSLQLLNIHKKIVSIKTALEIVFRFPVSY